MNKTSVIATKITIRMESMIEEIIERDTHITKGEFARNALRQHIKLNYPQIFEEHIKKEEI